MKGRSAVRIVLFTLAGILAVVLYKGIINKKDDYYQIEQLPEIVCYTLSGDKFVYSEWLTASRKTAIVFFHPECEFCRRELKGIYEHQQELLNIQWLFLTLAPTEVVENYLIECPLDNIPNAFVVRENWPDTYEKFSVKGPPALFIYDEQGKLIKRHLGAISIKTIIQELQ